MFKKLIILLFLIIIVCGNILFSNENPNEISNYYKDLIDREVIMPLPMLEIINEEKFNIIIGYLSDNEIIENYYYQVKLNIKYIENDNEIRQITIEERGIITFPDFIIENIEYHIFYYEIFFNKYNSWRGDPTGKCFSIIFENNEVIRRYYWR